MANALTREWPNVRDKAQGQRGDKHGSGQSYTGDKEGVMTRYPDARASANAGAAEITGLIPTCRATLLFLRHGVRDKTADRDDDKVGADLGEKDYERQG